MRAYAGIGSRTITDDERRKIKLIASYLAEAGFTLYSGNADGADKTFQIGSLGMFVSFLPWDRFNGVDDLGSYIVADSTAAQDSVKEHHPNPDALSPGARKLMARNYHQVMGYGDRFMPKVEFVICCATPVGHDGQVSGGTGQAVRIALANNIQVFNIRRPDDIDRIKTLLTNIETQKNQI